MYEHVLHRLWEWIANPGVNVALLLTIALMVPRAGRFAHRIVAREVAETQDDNHSKTSLAMAGVGIYVVQIIVYFVILATCLQYAGFSLADAAIPATVVSAAIGFGAQSIIADFLAGFFVLSEKQYGVGDWVRFEGNSINTEGTVISITMRSTKIRTLAQETVSIPNSTARVCINASNYFSRAVVVMPIPLHAAASATDAVSTATAAVNDALADPEIEGYLIGELEVHPATAVGPPSTVGMPWTLDIRFMIQVEAGMQWIVERALRLALLDAFWEEYGSATTVDGQPRGREAMHGNSPRPSNTSNNDQDTSRPLSESLQQLTGTHDTEPAPPRQGPAEPGAEVSSYRDDQAPTNHTEGTSENQADNNSNSEESERAFNRRTAYRNSLRETRASTLWLFILFLILLTAKLLTFQDVTESGDVIRGPLAPPSAEGTGMQAPPIESLVPTPNPE